MRERRRSLSALLRVAQRSSAMGTTHSSGGERSGRRWPTVQRTTYRPAVEDDLARLERLVRNGVPADALAFYGRWWQFETWLRDAVYVELRGCRSSCCATSRLRNSSLRDVPQSRREATIPTRPIQIARNGGARRSRIVEPQARVRRVEWSQHEHAGGCLPEGFRGNVLRRLVHLSARCAGRARQLWQDQLRKVFAKVGIGSRVALREVLPEGPAAPA
jgi:hypothetical protein